MQPEMSQIISALVIFALGNVSGYFLHDTLKKTMNVSESNSKSFLLFVVTIVWAISMLVGVVNPAYVVPLPVHAIMGAIVGFFFYRPKEGK